VLSGQSILCFAPDPWDDIWRNRHQIMSLLAERNQVLYVEPRPYLRPVLQRARRGEISWAELTAPRVWAAKPGLHVFRHPLYAPLSGRAPLSALTEALRIAALRRAMRQVGVTRPILWLFKPDMVDVPGHWGERLLIYHIVDEYTGYADVDVGRAEDIRRREQELIEKADLVLVTSRELLVSKGGVNPNTHWVPNAVDYDRFLAASIAETEPADLVGLPRPRIAYVGAVNDKLDVDLLLRVADAYPAYTLVLVGPVRVTTKEARCTIEALRTRPNVRLVGRVPVEQVPHYMAACDVGLLPYLRNDWTRHIHPLKMYEYLACGLPVVATDLPAVHEEADVVTIAADAKAFIAAIAQALRDDNDALRQARRDRAAQNTWRQRVERISELIQETMDRKSHHARSDQTDRRMV